MHKMNLLSLFICQFLIPIVLGGDDLYIKNILSNSKISDVKKDPTAPKQGNEDDWYHTFIREGNAMLPFAEHLIKEQAKNADAEKTLKLGAFVSLVGQGGGVLALMGLLKKKLYNVESIVVVVESKAGRDGADFKACMKIINEYDVGLKSKVFRVNDQTQDTKKFEEANYLQLVEMNGVEGKLKGAKFLAIALCGTTFNEIKERDGEQVGIRDVLKSALEVLPKLSHVDQTNKTVFSPNTPSGQDENGNWPIPNVEHKCTHVATLTWPIASVCMGDEVQVFVNVEKVQNTGDFPTFLDLMRTDYSKEKIGDLSTEIDALQKNENFQKRKWVELKGLHFV